MDTSKLASLRTTTSRRQGSHSRTAQEGAVESGTCTYGGQTHEVATYPVGSDVNG